MSLQASGSQTVGPYFSVGLSPLYRSELADGQVQGERIRVRGRVFDGDGAPVPDAVLEIWQANAAGRYNHPEDCRELPLDPHFFGFGRIATGAAGEFEFGSIKPGRVPAADGRLQAPHLLVHVFMRGLLRQVVTRIYFDGDAANAADPVLLRVPESRRGTLLAQRDAEGIYYWEVHMQGERETVFFAI
jgi:protocatechuate 3,4-dioxygenase, alpha subunit